MNSSRIVALFTVPLALSIAACSGGSSGVVGNTIGTGGQAANIRFVNGSPDIGSIDVYYQLTGAAAPSAPASPSSTNVAYAVVTPFIAEPPTAGTVLVRVAGSGSSSAVIDSLSCPIPQMATNAKYTVAIAGIGAGNHKCLLFQDFDYNTAPQYRFHNAAVGAQPSLAYTTTATSTAAGTAATYSSTQVANQGGNALALGGGAYTQVQPAGPIGNGASNPEFVSGPNTGSSTFPIEGRLNASAVFASGSHAQPDTTGTLNFTGTAGTSIFAIDCTPAAVAALGTGGAGVTCTTGTSGTYALIGTFDTL